MKEIFIIFLLLSSGFAQEECEDYFKLFRKGITVGTLATFAGAGATKAGLWALGFGSSGPIAGSVAAASQGASVAAGSWFAACQSMAMSGLAALMVPALIIGGVSLTGYTAYKARYCYNLYKEKVARGEEREHEQSMQMTQTELPENEQRPLLPQQEVQEQNSQVDSTTELNNSNKGSQNQSCDPFK